MYFYMGHYSKFLVPGSKRIDAHVDGLLAPEVISFLTPDGNVVTILLNTALYSKSYTITVPDGRGTITGKLDAHSIQTVVFMQ
jgi:glucosylceramidase